MDRHASDHDFTIKSPADLDRLIAQVSQNAPHYVPLVRAVRAGLIALVQPDRAAAVSTTRLKSLGRPVLVVLGDDDYEAGGPDGWRCAERVLGWSRQVLIHGAGARAIDYAFLPPVAMLLHRLVLIECASRQVDAWHTAAVRWARRADVQRVIPPDGIQHPAPLARTGAGGVH